MKSEFPIAVPPRQNADAEIIHIKDDQRTVAESFRRKVVAKTLAKFNDRLQDAACKINEAPKAYQAYARYGMFTYGIVYGSARDEVPEYLTKRFEIDRRNYESWRREMLKHPLPLSLCIGFCQDEKSIKQLRVMEKMRDSQAIALIQFGLNRYCIIAGWGDQVEPIKN